MKKKISLCVIAGNVEKIIGRFLDAFEGLADEVIVVQACGANPPDVTKTISRERGCKTAVYLNDVASWTRDWPHVDDFAAARNMACDMATGDWLIWADTDDMITPDSIAQIRQLVEDVGDADVDGVLMRYVIPEDGVINWRERLWRRGSARWEGPVHECLKFKEGAKHIRFDGAEIIHASEKRTAARDERNLRILETIPEDKRTVSQKFHVFQSLIALDRNDEAITKAIEFVQLPEVGKNERYEAFFQLARLADSPDQKHAMLLQACATDPTRREAFGELALACLPTDPAASLGWSEAMLALRMPQDAPWNLRRNYYGQLGIGLRGMALRANGRREEADVLETNHFIRAGAKISLLHATRGRPGKAWRTRMDWLRSAANPDAIEHIFAIDANDHESFLLANARCVIVTGNGGPVEAWNAAAAQSRGEVLVQLSDDFEPFAGWDLEILKAIGDTSKPAVLAVSDGHRTDDLLCMAILTRARYKEQGYLFHPEFFSMFSDNWFSHCASGDGVVIDARDRITFEHIHPAFGKAEMDATYARSNDGYHYKTGEGIFRRLKEGLTLSRDVHGWCDYRGFYSEIAKAMPQDAIIAEVGSWMGQSVIWLCQRLQDIGKGSVKVYCVDTWKGEAGEAKHQDIVMEHGGSIYEAFRQNIKSAVIADMVDPMISDSAEAACKFEDSSLDFVFIDAAHDYESVKADIEAWRGKVKKTGIMAGHDVDAESVQRALADCGIKHQIIGRCWIQTNEEKP